MTTNRIEIRRDTTANWTIANPVLSSGELSLDSTTGLLRIGDGSTPWLELVDTVTRALSVPTSPAALQLSATLDGKIIAERATTAAAILPNRRSANTIALLGDSITAMTVAQNGVYTTKDARGYWGWASMRLGQRIDLVARAGTLNGGITGQTTAQILARVQSDVIDLAPGWCHVLAGTNDMLQSVPVATTIANLTAIYNTLAAAGIRVVAGTIPPFAAATTAQFRLTEALNQFVRSQGLTRRGFVVADYHAVLAGPTGTWRIATVAYTADGTHPSAGGAARMGKVLADALAPRVPAVNRLPSSNMDDADSGAALPNLAPNPMFTGTTGTVGAGGSGVMPTSWTLNRSGGSGSLTGTVVSVVSRTDDKPGQWLQIASTTIVDAIRVQAPSIAGVTAGDRIQVMVEFETEGITDLSTLRAIAIGSDSTAGYATRVAAYDIDLNSADDREVFPNGMIPSSGVLQTPWVTYPANSNILTVGVDFTGVGTLRLARFAIRKAV